MNKRRDDRQKLDRLIDSLSSDIDRLSDKAVLEEASEVFGAIDIAVKQTRAVVEEALKVGGKSRLDLAKQDLAAYRVKSAENLKRLPLEQKLELLRRFAQSSGNDAGITMAARNETNTEGDIDGLLEDLFDLGAIDNEGNVR
ncbi:MAG: hypothetical protein AB7M05_01750 [Alphaproteobacteria bacterium]